MTWDPPPLPRPWLMRQRWSDLVFVHWRVPVVDVEHLFPAGVRPDTPTPDDPTTYVGLVWFVMTDAGFAHGPPVPFFGSFLECNVRLYSIDDEGRRGVLFLSLDAERLVVVAGANVLLGTPYRWARMRRRQLDDGLSYDLVRRSRGRPRSSLTVRHGDPVEEPTTLERFVTARFGLHTTIGGRTFYVPNTHAEWPLRFAELTHLDDDLVAAAGLPEVTADRPVSVLSSPGVHTVFAMPRRVRSSGAEDPRLR